MVGINVGTTPEGKSITLLDQFNTQIAEHMGVAGDWVSLALFTVMALVLYFVAVKKNPEEAKSHKKLKNPLPSVD
jgi:hypothetical protein